MPLRSPTRWVNPEEGGTLPRDGERLVFGIHRMPRTERLCAAWPANPNPFSQRAARILRGRRTR
jgi:hypothetical protein